MKILRATVLALLTANCTTVVAPLEILDSSSFELALPPWRPVAIDTGATGSGHAPWSVLRSMEASSHGSWSARIHAFNGTDAVKVWIERSYRLTRASSGAYDVAVSFDFGTSDSGTINLWRIVAGAFDEPPRDAETLAPAFRDETGGASPSAVSWLPKNYTTRVTTEGEYVHVVIGVWGTFETERTYFIDNVRVVITPASATTGVGHETMTLHTFVSETLPEKTHAAEPVRSD